MKNYIYVVARTSVVDGESDAEYYAYQNKDKALLKMEQIKKLMYKEVAPNKVYKLSTNADNDPENEYICYGTSIDNQACYHNVFSIFLNGHSDRNHFDVEVLRTELE